jgi:predicted phosphodiesterase
MKIAAISDIHGNLGALDAVLADIRQCGADISVNLGDSLSGPLCPADTADRLMGANIRHIRGNHERQLLTLPVPAMGLSDQFTRAALRPDQLDWLQSLPDRLELGKEVLLLHGTPDSDLDYFLEQVSASGLQPATQALVQARTGNCQAGLILCGHSHLPGSMQLTDGRLVVNPGSVGLQAYEDTLPFPHRIETGSPHARYALLELKNGQWSVDWRRVAYDWEAAAAMALRHHRPDWIEPLRSGRI